MGCFNRFRIMFKTKQPPLLQELCGSDSEFEEEEEEEINTLEIIADIQTIVHKTEPIDIPTCSQSRVEFIRNVNQVGYGSI